MSYQFKEEQHYPKRFTQVVTLCCYFWGKLPSEKQPRIHRLAWSQMSSTGYMLWGIGSQPDAGNLQLFSGFSLIERLQIRLNLLRAIGTSSIPNYSNLLVGTLLLEVVQKGDRIF